MNMVEAAVELAGGVSKVAKELQVSRQTVYNWISTANMKTVRHKYVVALSKLSGIPAEQLASE